MGGIVPGAGNPQALNRYAYVFNNPLKFIDPSGHLPFDRSLPVPDATFDYYGSEKYKKWYQTKAIKKELSAYDTNVTFNVETSVDDQLKILKQVRSAVHGFVNRIAESIPELPIRETRSDPRSLYKQAVGTTNIRIEAAAPSYSREDNKLGCLPGYAECKYGNNNGNGMIKLSQYLMLNGGSISGDPLVGTQLAAHEIAHNITQQIWSTKVSGNQAGDPSLSWYDDTLTIAPGETISYVEGFGVRAGNYGDKPESEITADAIASWGLNDFVGRHAQARRVDISQYMAEILSNLIP